MKKFILSLDQGTTSSRALIVDSSGQILGVGQVPFQQHFPKAGWVEHDALEIYSTTLSAIQMAIKNAGIHAHEIATIGITNQRETVVAWDSETQKPLAPAIVWQCRRTSQLCQTWKPKWEKVIKKKTGLVLDPYFSGTKIHWMLKNISEVKKAAKGGRLRFGNIDAWLLFKLTKGSSFKTDVSNASRTMLMNLKTLQWDSDLCRLMGVSEKQLPQICESNAFFGETKGVSGLPDGISIQALIGDQQAALFGQRAFAKGQSKCTFGTGSFLLMNLGHQPLPSQKLLTTVAWKLAGQKPVYALEGGAFICGAAVQWLRDGLQIIKKSSEVEELAQKVKSSEGVFFVPALSGLGAPYWDSEARGVLCGLTRGTHRGHIARATLEAMAFQNAEIFIQMIKESRVKLKSVAVDGGATQNNLLMQIQADIVGVKIQRPRDLEVTALGAAFLAGLGCGLWKNLVELEKLNPFTSSFSPKISKKARDFGLKNWQEAVKKTMDLSQVKTATILRSKL